MQRNRYKTDPEKYKEQARNGSLKHRYGLTPEQFEELVALQSGVCAICQEADSRRLSVDHDHGCCPSKRSCGKCIRGLICNGCNRLLGMAGDDPQRLAAAAAYLGG